MARAFTGKMTRGNKGFFRTIGHYILDGRRAPRKFWLGHDRASAKCKVEALENAWDNLTGERGQKVERRRYRGGAGVDFQRNAGACGRSHHPRQGPAAGVRPEPVPPPLPIRTYTLPEALDEFTKFFDARSDIT